MFFSMEKGQPYNQQRFCFHIFLCMVLGLFSERGGKTCLTPVGCIVLLNQKLSQLFPPTVFFGAPLIFR